MNPNTATDEELRDWLAEHAGWRRLRDSWALYADPDDEQWKELGEHPFPNTIDAAAKCLPEGWTECWCKSSRYAYRPFAEDTEQSVGVWRTTDEATDRFRLAVKAIQAMEDGNGS